MSADPETLGGSIELVRNAAQIAELAIEKRAQTILMPVSARRQLNDLADDMWTKINIEFYRDVPDAVFKALEEQVLPPHRRHAALISHTDYRITHLPSVTPLHPGLAGPGN